MPMLPEIGHFALVLALAIALVQAIAPLIGARRNDATLMGVADSTALPLPRTRIRVWPFGRRRAAVGSRPPRERGDRSRSFLVTLIAVVALADTATHVPAANALLDYLMGSEWGLGLASAYGYAPTSEAAFDAFTPEVAEKVAIDPSRVADVQFRQPFDREKYTALWAEVQAA